jgi:hypothetical protein
VGDVNGDDLPDIVTGDAAPAMDEVSVWLNSGPGTFTFQVQTAWQFDNPNPVDLAIADLDNDGFDDLVVANGPSPDVAVQIYYGNATGIMDTSSVAWPFLDTRSLALLDWNRDGLLDIVFGNGSAGADPQTVHLYVCSAARTYLGTPDYSLSTPDDSTGIAVADFNDDAYPDFVQTFVADPAIVWMNSGSLINAASLGSTANDVATGRFR